MSIALRFHLSSSLIMIQYTRNNPEFNASNTCPCVVIHLCQTHFSVIFSVCVPPPPTSFLCEFLDITKSQARPWDLGAKGLPSFG